MLQYILYSDLNLEEYAKNSFEERILKPFKSNWNQNMYYFRNELVAGAEDEASEEYYDQMCDEITIGDMKQAYNIYMLDAEFNDFVWENEYLSVITYDDFITDKIVVEALVNFGLGDETDATKIARWDFEIGYPEGMNIKSEMYKLVDNVVDSYDFGVNSGSSSKLYNTDFIVNLVA